MRAARGAVVRWCIRVIGWVVLTGLSACSSVGVGISIPIGGISSIGVGVGNDGRVSGGVSVGRGGVSVGVGGTLGRPPKPAEPAASQPKQ